MRSAFVIVLSSVTSVACQEPTVVADGKVAPPASASGSGAPGSTDAEATAPSASASGARAAASGASAAPPPSASASPPALPPLLDADDEPLPQTDDKPTTEDPVFRDRLERLWQAIVTDDPEKARDFFFPVEAYQQVKAIEKPERDWKYRLWKNFVRDVRGYHKRLGKTAEERAGAKFIELELRNEPAWMKPGREGNLVGYFRVTRSLLHYETADGKKRRLDLTSMISWRGHWYVVHLHGFE